MKTYATVWHEEAEETFDRLMEDHPNAVISANDKERVINQFAESLCDKYNELFDDLDEYFYQCEGGK